MLRSARQRISAMSPWSAILRIMTPYFSEIRETGDTLPETRLKLSAKAYTHTALYDSHIASYMRRQAGLDEKLFLAFDECPELALR